MSQLKRMHNLESEQQRSLLYSSTLLINMSLHDLRNDVVGVNFSQSAYIYCVCTICIYIATVLTYKIVPVIVI